VERDFRADGPDQLWVGDVTYIPWAGFLNLAVVLDTWSRRIVGWAMATRLRTELVLEAFNMVTWQRRTNEVTTTRTRARSPGSRDRRNMSVLGAWAPQSGGGWYGGKGEGVQIERDC
jgi:transposase InsO family protein